MYRYIRIAYDDICDEWSYEMKRQFDWRPTPKRVLLLIAFLLVCYFFSWVRLQAI